ncbi:MAG: hypothetical protein U0800_02825 [Isosphaeraceae bacterium]
MAIVDTLESCLASPYLFSDPQAPGRVADLLAIADDRLDLVRAVLEQGTGEADDVNQYCYEAMFACVRALVYAKGYREAGLRCLLIACRRFHVEGGSLDPAHLRDLERIQGRRTRPEEAYQAAGSFLGRTRVILQTTPTTA